MAIMDDAARQKAEFFKQKRAEGLGQVAAQGQEQQDVIQRRFASLGAQGSGAQFGIAQKAQEAQAAQARQIQNDIMGQEIAAAEPDLARRFQAEQTKLGQEYGTQERLGQQQFAGEQAESGRKFQAEQQLAQNIFASGEAALGRKFTSEEQAKQNQFLAGQSQASRDLQAKMAADDLALKKSMADMQNATTKEQLAMAAEQYKLDKETTAFNKYVSLITMGFSRIDAQNMAFGNVGPNGPLPGSQPSQQAVEPQVTTNMFGVPTLPPLPENATQAERFEYQRKQQELLDKWSATNTFGQIDIGIH